MARSVVNEVDQLVKRVRQIGNIALDYDLATEIFTTCQQVMNIALKQVVVTQALSLTAGKQLYAVRDDINASAVDVVSIDQSGRELLKAKNLVELAAYDFNFFGNSTGTRPEAWCSIGRDYVIIYPGLSSSQSVNVSYVKMTTLYADYSALTGTTYVELPDEHIELVHKLAECILLVRARDYTLIEHHLIQLKDLFKAKNVKISE